MSLIKSWKLDIGIRVWVRSNAIEPVLVMIRNVSIYPTLTNCGPSMLTSYIRPIAWGLGMTTNPWTKWIIAITDAA